MLLHITKQRIVSEYPLLDTEKKRKEKEKAHNRFFNISKFDLGVSNILDPMIYPYDWLVHS